MKRSFIKAGIIAIVLSFVLVLVGGAFVFGAEPPSGDTKDHGKRNVLKIQDLLTPFSLKYLILMNQIKGLLEKYYVEGPQKIDDKKLMYGALKGMVSAVGDPYTRFVDPEELKDDEIEMKGEYGGIGIYITQRDGRTIIVSPIEDTPGERVGLKPHDEIVKVGDKIITGMDQRDVVKMLRGKPGTKVVIWVRREGVDHLLKFEIVREKIKLKTVKYRLLEKECAPYKIGYLRISYFNTKTASELISAIKNLKKEGPPDAYILDLRNDPGGLLDAAIDVASLFIPPGLVVSVKGRSPRVNGEYMTTLDRMVFKPVVVLINRGSASASEIVAGALKDRGDAVLVGEKSFGKGSVQTLFRLPDGCGVYITVAKYYTPAGLVIDHKGLQPDVKVEGEFTKEIEKDKQLKEAIKVLLRILSPSS